MILIVEYGISPVHYQFVAFPTLSLKSISRDNMDNSDQLTFDCGQDGQFPDFPVLKHHSHPYFVIANALPKFKKHQLTLTEMQSKIYTILLQIEDIWKENLPELVSHKQHMDSDPGEGPSKKQEDSVIQSGAVFNNINISRSSIFSHVLLVCNIYHCTKYSIFIVQYYDIASLILRE